jgi:hypothetical protein
MIMHVNQTSTSPKLFKWVLLTLSLTSVLCFAPAADAAQPPWANGESNPEDLEIKLVTFGVGDRIVEWFGHTALVVEDTELDRARLYNYGMFSFDSTMLMKFAMGRLWFWVGQAPAEPTYNLYERYGRDVRIIELNLPPEKRQEVATFLAEDVLPENRDYLYHHYDDNCSTRIRDIIDSAVDGRLEELSSKPSPRTLRDLTRIHSHHNPPMEMLLMFLMNDSIDQQITYWDEMFLPIRLENWIHEVEYSAQDGEMVALAGEERIFYDAGRPPLPDKPLTRWPYWLAFGLFVGGMAVGVGRWRQANPDRRGARVAHGLVQTLVGLMIGVVGLGLFVMASFTDHEVTYWNENLMLANPLTFLALPLGLMIAFGSERAEHWLQKVWYVCGALAVLLLPLKALPSFEQGNWLVIAYMLPVVLGAAAGAHFAAETTGAESTEESGD